MWSIKKSTVLFVGTMLFLAACDRTPKESITTDSIAGIAEAPNERNAESDSMYYLLVSHTIADFSQWKEEFAKLEERRNVSGLVQVASFTSFLDSSLVCVLFHTSKSASAMDFANSKVNFAALNRVSAASPDIRTMTAGQALSDIALEQGYYILVQHPVTDYTQWEKTYRQSEEVREGFDLTELGIFTRPEDQNDVAILLSAPTLKRSIEYASLLLGSKLMETAGVSDAPIALVMVKFDSTL